MTSARAAAPLTPGDRVVVIGAGPAGLTAAHLLSRKDVRAVVLEADDIVGGIARTVEYKGFRFDIGGHRFFTRIEPVERLWEEILGEDFLTVPRLSRIYYNGRFFDYPLKPLNALRGLGPWRAIRIVLSYVHARLDPSPVEENFEQWVTNRFGVQLYEVFFKTYTEKVWGTPCHEISAEWAAQRIQGMSLAKAILASAPLNRRSTKIKSLIREFRYPRLGPGQMWERCRTLVEQAGHDVRLRHRVRALELDGQRVVAVRVQTPSGDQRLECDHCISTMPLRTLMRTFDPAAPPAARRAGDGLKYRDFLVVVLIVNRAHLFADNWLYIHTPGVKVGRIQNFNNWSAAMVPRPGVTSIGMEYFCFEGDGLWQRDDQKLIALATQELSHLGLANADDVVDGTVTRMPKAYPVYDLGYRTRLAQLRQFIDPIANLHTVGRNGMHKYNNQDHSMLTAMMTVWNMEGAAHDVWSVNSDFDYHEEQRLDQPAAGTIDASG